MKRFDYRREFMTLTLEQLKDRLPSLQSDFDKWFVKPFEEEADKVYKKISYVKNKINALS